MMNNNQFNQVAEEKDNSQEQYGAIQIDSIEVRTDIISPENDRFPYCIVWTALPLITWIIPFIGHTGIALSSGVIHDFAGPYTIAVDNFSFGKPLKYVKINQENLNKEKYDAAIIKADNNIISAGKDLNFKLDLKQPIYYIYNIILKQFILNYSNNCHNHVADALNYMSYKGKENWNMVSIWFICLWSSHYVSWGALILTYLPITIIIVVSIIIAHFS